MNNTFKTILKNSIKKNEKNVPFWREDANKVSTENVPKSKKRGPLAGRTLDCRRRDYKGGKGSNIRRELTKDEKGRCEGSSGNSCEDMCLLKKLKLLKPSDKAKPKREIQKNKRIKKNFKLRRREARRRRRAKRKMNKMMKFKFDEEMLNKVKNNVLLMLNVSPSAKKITKKPLHSQSPKVINQNAKLQNIRIIGNIREIRAPLLGKRSDSVKSIETTDGETEEDGFRGKKGCCGQGGCCGWQQGQGLINQYSYDICPVKDCGLLQAKKKKGKNSTGKKGKSKI